MNRSIRRAFKMANWLHRPHMSVTSPTEVPRTGYPKGGFMRIHRFGRKLKLPSTVAIKHQLLRMMLEDEIRAIPPGGCFKENESPALAMLRRLRGAPAPPVRPD
jgi:hypothetical protein